MPEYSEPDRSSGTDTERRVHPGDRVTHRHADYGPGTVLGVDFGRASVSWDISATGHANYPGMISLDDLEIDADLPDPKLALAKALDYKRSRDEMLKQLWGTADAVAEAKLNTGRAYSIAHEMTRRYELERVQLDRAREALVAQTSLYREAQRVLGYVAVKLSGLDAELAQKISDYLDHGELPATLAE